MKKYLQLPPTLVIIVLIALIVRLISRASFLEDWDSVQFALSLHNYSLIENLPHAPGYPLYVLLGKIFYLFIPNDTQALTTLSAILGSLATIPLYLLSKKMFSSKVALLSSILFILMPVQWTLSITALTNIPGLFFLLIYVLFLYTKAQNPKALIIISGFGGLILGVRFTEFPVIISLLLLAHLRTFNRRLILLSALSFLAGMAVWVIPIMIISGFDQFLQAYGKITNYILTHDSQISSNFNLKSLIKSRLGNLWYLLQVSYTSLFILTSTLALLHTLRHQRWLKEWRYQVLLVWLLSYLMPLTVIYNLEVPRYTLPLLPPLVILTAAAISIWVTKRVVFIVVPFIIIGMIFAQSWSQITRFNTQLPPTIKPIEYVKKSFNPQKTVLLTSYTYRQFQYYAPEFKNYYSDKITNINADPDTTIIVDFLGLKDKIANSSDFKVVSQQTFIGDKDIFARIPEITLYILEKK